MIQREEARRPLTVSELAFEVKRALPLSAPVEGEVEHGDQVLDAVELKLIIEGKPLPARVVPQKGGDDGVQQVLKPEPGRTPGILPGKPSPA